MAKRGQGAVGRNPYKNLKKDQQDRDAVFWGEKVRQVLDVGQSMEAGPLKSALARRRGCHRKGVDIHYLCQIGVIMSDGNGGFVRTM